MTVERIYVFKRFERFWHWSQAALIITMMLTGFEVHGAYDFFGFGKAVALHTLGAWSLIALWVFAIFWHLTTGEWRQYIPTLDKINAIIRFYALDIFKGAPHPYRPTALKKHNPLQRLAYLVVLLFISPILWISGWFYLFYGEWTAWGVDGFLSLEWVALFHTAGAFMMLAFFIAHVYLTTTGHTPMAHIKTMFTGWDEVH